MDWEKTNINAAVNAKANKKYLPYLYMKKMNKSKINMQKIIYYKSLLK
jgi:hypothetical protein